MAFSTIISMGGYSQRLSLELTFTAIDSAAYVQLDSIKVMNRTQGDYAMLYWPDTTLSYEITAGDLLLFIGYSTGYYPVGVLEISQEKKQFQLFQNYPNPVIDQSVISMYIPEKGVVNVLVTDITGRLVLSSDWQLDKSIHSFRFAYGDGNLFFLTARWNGISRSIKILTTGSNSGKRCTLDYTGSGNGEPQWKVTLPTEGFMQESGVLDSPNKNETYTFQFATNIPCPGTPTVTYEGQVYNTIQIFSQCWLKENMNVGVMINSSLDMQNNGITEKYCYNNKEDSCTKYGGLYRWNEMMQYTLQQGTRGICPPDWHIPTDEEWKVLEGAVDSLYGIGATEWDFKGLNGYDAGMRLKTTSGWYSWDDKGYSNFDVYTNLKNGRGWYDNGNGTNSFGFSGLPGGYCDAAGYFSDIIANGYWWTSTQYTNQYGPAWHHCLSYHDPEVIREDEYKGMSNSVRCIRDY